MSRSFKLGSVYFTLQFLFRTSPYTFRYFFFKAGKTKETPWQYVGINFLTVSLFSTVQKKIAFTFRAYNRRVIMLDDNKA